MSQFEDFVNTELPLRPALIKVTDVGGYDNDPNSPSAPAKLQGAPVGTYYLRNTPTTLYQKLTAGTNTWTVPSGGGNNANLTPLNKGMEAIPTLSDGNLATLVVLGETPPLNSWIMVFINGISVEVGNGNKQGHCYFSGDGGGTPRATGQLTQGDKLFWNGSVAGFQLDSSDLIDFIFDAV